jgi:hypothetical protein
MIINNIEIKHGRSAEPSETVCDGCPCTYTEESEIISNYGCLPDWNNLVEYYLNNKGIWKCHSKDRVCGGLIEILKSNDIPLNKNNSLLITEDNPLCSTYLRKLQ